MKDFGKGFMFIWTAFLKLLWFLIMGTLKVIKGFFKFLYWLFKVDQYIHGFRSMCALSIFLAVLFCSCGAVAFFTLDYAYKEEFAYDRRNTN